MTNNQRTVTIVSFQKTFTLELPEAPMTVRAALASFLDCLASEVTGQLQDNFARLNGVDVTEALEAAISGGDFLFLVPHEIAHRGIRGEASLLRPYRGIRMYMYANDHPPPHFHVESPQGRASIAIDDARPLHNSLSPKTFGLIQAWARTQFRALHENWQRSREGLPLKPMAPFNQRLD